MEGSDQQSKIDMKLHKQMLNNNLRQEWGKTFDREC